VKALFRFDAGGWLKHRLAQLAGMGLTAEL
jgi:hypothetical protein